MAKLLYRKGKFKILAQDVGKLSSVEINQLIKDAGTTCYQTRDSSRKTPEKFIEMLYARTHFSVLEHSWFCFEVMDNDYNALAKLGFGLYRINNLFSITEKNLSRGRHALIISGNARMFVEAIKRSYPDSPTDVWHFLHRLNLKLYEKNPALFPLPKEGMFLPPGGHKFRIIEGPALDSKEERLMHIAMCVQFDEHCRGFTHEHVRHRLGAYSQESTRYVDYAMGEENLEKFQIKLVLPYRKNLDPNEAVVIDANGVKFKWNWQQIADFYEASYRAMRKKGFRPEEARQLLPIGIKSQIVTTFNLKEWRYWFYRRANESAHPEIRWSAVRLLKFCQKEWPDLFDDFEIVKTKDGINHAVFHGNKDLI